MERSRRGTRPRAAEDTTTRVRRRTRRKTPVALYVAALVVALALLAIPLWAFARRAATKAPAPAGAGTTTATAATPDTVTAPAVAATVTPAAGSAEATPAAGASDAAAVAAAAVRYPGPPEVRPRTIRKVSTDKKYVAITLDDGIPFNTAILDLLDSHGVKCTTFMTGQAVKAHPDLVKRLHDSGYEIANHTWDHKILTKLSDSEVREELADCQKRISAITGNQAPYMRPPGGGTSKRIERIAGEMGFNVVMWNKSFADTSKYATPEKLYHNVMDDLKPGDVILCHWGAASKTGGPGNNTLEALKLILPEMERRGFTPVTVSELLKHSAQGGE